MNKRKQPSHVRDLPQPTSPAALDQKILAHARAQAPAKPNPWRSPWVGGLATASIVTVALLIANPSVQVPESGPTAILMEEQAAYAERREVAAERSSTSADEHGVRKMLQRQDDSAAGAEQGMAQPLAGATAARLSKQNTFKKQLEEKDDFEFDAAPPARETLVVQLRDLQEIFASGKEDLARERYQILREDCALCELPPTLELALKQLAEREKSAEK